MEEKQVKEIVIGVPYEIDITATGIANSALNAEFSIKMDGIFHNIPMNKIADEKYVVTVPSSLSIDARKNYIYHIFVYYDCARFEADKGSLKFIKEPVSLKKNKEEKKPVKVEKKAEKVVEKVEPKKPVSDKQLLDKLSEKIVEKKTKTEEKKPEVQVTPTIDQEKKKKVNADIQEALSNALNEKKKKKLTIKKGEIPTAGKMDEEFEKLQKEKKKMETRKKIRDAIKKS